MDALLEAIVVDDRPQVEELLRADTKIATHLIDEARLYESKIFHWIYVGDTALHLAAAGYRVEIVRRLFAAGADPNAARNHRKSAPLHYAADGCVHSSRGEEIELYPSGCGRSPTEPLVSSSSKSELNRCSDQPGRIGWMIPYEQASAFNHSRRMDLHLRWNCRGYSRHVAVHR